MKKTKKGISLIVLIITIIVIVILATAILVSVLSNNPISEANKARYESDRDNMQAVFTNTVGKIMAENQGVVNVTAGQVNTETTGVNETTGEVAYTVDNATVAANASGTIKFDKGTNDATTYYTGKKLPIYAAGETKWYVDSEGVLSLEVAGVKYGSGEVEKLTYTSLGNYQHQLSDGMIESHDTESGICSKCGENVLVPGLYYLYDGNKKLRYSWEQLTDGSLKVSRDEIGGTTSTQPVLLISETGKLSSGGYGIYGKNMSVYNYLSINDIIVLDTSVITIGSNVFSDWGYEDDTMYPGINKTYDVICPDSVTTIDGYAFKNSGLKNLTISKSLTTINAYAFNGCTIPLTINYTGTQLEWNSIVTLTDNWNKGCSAQITVHCTDGDIIIPAWTE